MAQRNDDELVFYLAAAVKASGHISDENRDWLLGQLAPYTGAMHINDLWVNFFIAEGIAPGHFNDMAYAWLLTKGVPVGHISDMWAYYYSIPVYIAELLTGLFTNWDQVLTHSRAATQVVVDHESNNVTILSEEAGFTGGRRVRNFLTWSNDFTNGDWVQVDSVTSKTYTDSNGVSGDEITENSEGQNYFVQAVTATVDVGSIWVFSCEVAFESPGAAVVMLIERNDAGPYESANAAITPTADFQRFRVTTTAGTFANSHTSIRISIGRGVGDPAVIAVRNAQLEEVTDKAVQTPGEYLSTNELSGHYHGSNVDGVKWFDYENGNIIGAGNMVVEAQGAAISGIKGVKLDANSLLTLPSIGIPLNDITIKLNWTPTSTLQGTVFLFASYVDANNYTAILTDNVNLIARKRIGGVNTDATIAFVYSADTQYALAARFSSVDGIDVFLDTVKGTNDVTTTDLQVGSTYAIGSDGNSANKSLGSFSGVEIHHTSLIDADI